MFADDIMMGSERREQVEDSLESRRYSLKGRGIKTVEARQNTCV